MSGEQTSRALPSRCSFSSLTWNTIYIHLLYLCSSRLNLKYKILKYVHPTIAVVKDTPIPQRLEMPSFTPPKHLDLTIYPTEVGVSSVSGREGEPQMLSTAIKVTLDPQRSVKVSHPQTPDFYMWGKLFKLWN